MIQSNFKLVGTGIVVKDKLEDDYFAEIHPVEAMPSITGDYNEKESKDIEYETPFGKTIKNKIDKQKTITCKWIGLYNSNRVSAPDVVIGEMVYLFQKGGSDEYLWASGGLNLRKKEKVLWTFANKNESKPNEDTGEEHYYALVDTRNKEIVLKTVDNDGEKSYYDAVLNTKEGTFSKKDKQGNYLHHESTLNEGTRSIKINDTMQYKTKHSIRESDKTITTKTKDHSDNNDNYVSNTKNNYNINTDKYRVEIGGDELLRLMMDWCNVCIGDIGIGNDGFPVPRNGETKSAYRAIRERIRRMRADSSHNDGKQWVEKDE